MLEQTLVQMLLLLGLTVFVVLLFQRMRIPPSLAYLLVGVVLGSNTAGPVIDDGIINVIAQFGIVFLLFTIGLSFSLSQIYALRHTILGLGSAQVGLTTAVVGLGAWLLGLPAAAAFVVGAVFAQSSTTIISKQLTEQGEDGTRHGRLGVTLSVFQDITAVPFVVIIPVLGIAAAHEVAGELGLAMLKAAAAFIIVLAAGRFVLKPLFHMVAERRSAELFTLTVLFVSLVAAWATKSLGLSMAFGAFLAGMVLGETEFRHQVESTIRPFRDVLLGLFFVSIGMLVEPAALPDIWLQALIAALALLAVKLLLVVLIVRVSGVDLPTAFRTGMLLAVGGEFGFALLAIGLDAAAIDGQVAQVILTAVLFSMILAPFLIRFNQPICQWLFHPAPAEADQDALSLDRETGQLAPRVVLCGFGRTGQTISRFLEHEQIGYVALDLDPSIVREARLAGQPVFYGDSADPGVLEMAGLPHAALLIVSHDDLTAALKTLSSARKLNPNLTSVVRTRDEKHVDDLRQAGASEVIPEALEAGLMIVSHSLFSLNVPHQRITNYIRQQREERYPMIRALFRGNLDDIRSPEDAESERLHSVPVNPGAPAIGRPIGALALDAVRVTALVRAQQRTTDPDPQTTLQAGDVLVLLGSPSDLKQAEALIAGS